MGNKSVAIVAVLFMAVLVMSFTIVLTPKQIEIPQGWPTPNYDFDKNPISAEGVALGRYLFYDSILSLDSTISCASCHLSFTAFTHVDHKLSHGIHDSIGTRNSMTLMNLAWARSFMWDGAINHLDMQALAPISHAAEMGEDIANVVDKLNHSSTYRARFNEVFGVEEVTGEKLLKALAQFQLTLISSNSKYDRMMRGEEGQSFNEQEERGQALFDTHCNSCHQAPLFTTGDFANNGLPLDPFLLDIGRMGITGEAQDSMKFKIPSLRNIEFSKPYMHDGRFATLLEVIDHYQCGVLPNPTLAPELKNGVSLTSNEKVDLIAFLLTLTDRDFLFNPAFGFPRYQ